VISRNILDVLPDKQNRGQLAQVAALLQAGLAWMGRLIARRRRGPSVKVFAMVFPIGDVAHGSGAIVGVAVPIVQRRLIERDAPRIMAELHLRVARLADHGLEIVRRPLAPARPPRLSTSRLVALHLRQPFAKEDHWRLMQRIETYRLRAECLLAPGRAAFSAERQLAQMWLRLADCMARGRR